MSEENYSQSCAAYSCPLAGTISNGVSGKLKFYCRYHNGKHTSEFDAITARIKKNSALLNYFFSVNNGGPVTWKYRTAFPPAGFEIRENESWADYTRRLRIDLSRLILD